MIDWFEARLPDEAATPGHRAEYGLVLFIAGRRDEARGIYDLLVRGEPDSENFRGFRVEQGPPSAYTPFAMSNPGAQGSKWTRPE